MATGYYKVREKKNDFKKEMTTSVASIQWLEYMSRQKEIHIRHQENSKHGEKRIENYSVDGFCQETNTVFEYNGCFHHGHKDCGNYNAYKWKQTQKRQKKLIDLGNNVEVIYECDWKRNPQSKKRYRIDTPTCTYEDIKDAIMTKESFGIVKCSIHVPEDKIDHFSEFPVIFKNSEITLADIGPHMQEYCRSITRKTGVSKSLISSMKGDGIIIATPLFEKYIQLGLVCTDIEWIIEYHPKKVFEWFRDEVIHDRRMADLDPNWAIRGETSKCKGNCAYGRCLMCKEKHTNISFVSSENIETHVKNPLLKNIEKLEGDIYEVEKTKKKVVFDNPIQIGICVYSYAKLKLIEFWEFINYYLVNDFYQLMQTDTDSLYIALARENIDDCVKPHLLEEWKMKKSEFFTSTDTTPIIFEGRSIPFSQYDKRTPFKFKPEFIGHEMICINSKCYLIEGKNAKGEIITKTSAKGSNKKRNELLKEDFSKTLKTKKGFIRDGLDIKTYTQKKVGFRYFYAKRQVLSDGISTTHLDI